MSASRELVEDKLDAKDDARNNRLNIRKNNLEVFRKEFQKESKLKCADVIKQFGECAQRNGLMVVFRCHKENKAMSDCTEAYCTDEAFEAYVRDRIATKASSKD